ncbi:cation transporter [Nostoc sp. KVJ20]|uniref:cation diffusion facilitator family transporter n=1 Tax=Nostoc sp. KVJ20 TaxID=457944 RepID=UPI00083DDB0C|nr:cation diffusion facilitator family transporter [Nostoc sp. KVJ20]ODG97968.1 cation transporter [Nostoc sp. KVJ20]
MLSLKWCECSCADDSPKMISCQQKSKFLWIAVYVLVGFLVAEWSVGLWSRSLSLQADAGHILADVAALLISLLATIFAQQPVKSRATFGNQRLEVFAALINGFSLIAIANFIIWEAIHRWQNPEPILGLPMLFIAVLGLIVNIFSIKWLHPHTHNDLNLQGVFLHVIADTVSSVGVIIAALLIHIYHWWWADAAISLVVAVFIGLSALPLVKESLNIFLEYAPESIPPDQVEIFIKSFPNVLQVEKLHIWKINSNSVMLCANLTVECATIHERDRLLQKLQIHLQKTFGITEMTLQLSSYKSLSETSINPLLNQDLALMLSANQSRSNL